MIENGTLDSTAFGVQAGTVDAVLGGSGVLTKTGSGTTILSATNTYSGGTTIDAGTLQITGSGTLGAATSRVDREWWHARPRRHNTDGRPSQSHIWPNRRRQVGQCGIRRCGGHGERGAWWRRRADEKSGGTVTLLAADTYSGGTTSDKRLAATR